jgi:hypothetical protein
MYKSETIFGMSVQLVFQIAQHKRDELLIQSLVSYFGCGRYEPSNNKDFGQFVIRKLEDLTEKVIPFFDKYKIVGIKAMDYKDFCNIAKIMKDKSHLTPEGLKKIKSLKSGMNKGRILN